MSKATQIATTQSGIPALAMDENELIGVLTTSLYPGAAIASIRMVLGYCRAGQLDPLQKPVHIVPMWDKTTKAMRDVIMPGIGLYRTQAARTGEYAGVTEPEYGTDVTEKLGGVDVTYPKWCKVAVKRKLASGEMAEFTAVEFWKENYATAGKDSEAPNAMWKKRPYGQISKCAEAQALRKAFPEVGSAPTADEMEGKEINSERDVTPAQQQPQSQPEKPQYPDDRLTQKLPDFKKKIEVGASAASVISFLSTNYTLSPTQQAKINALEESAPVVIDGELVDEFVSEINAHEAQQ